MSMSASEAGVGRAPPTSWSTFACAAPLSSRPSALPASATWRISFAFSACGQPSFCPSQPCYFFFLVAFFLVVFLAVFFFFGIVFLLGARSGRPHWTEASPREDPLSTKICSIMPNLYDGVAKRKQIERLGTRRRSQPCNANRSRKLRTSVLFHLYLSNSLH